MPAFLFDVRVRNVVMNDDAVKELNAVLLERVATHNKLTSVPDEQLVPLYVVRFDSRGYRTYSEDEAWGYFKSAHKVERIILGAQSVVSVRSNNQAGEHIEIRLDTVDSNNSLIIVGGESKDWVEGTFNAVEAVLRRRRDLATSLFRTPWTGLLLQVAGVCLGILLALWLSGLTAPLLKDVEYPRAVMFAFWLLMYSNLWGYIQQRGLAAIDALFPNIRFARDGEHWAQKVLREGVKGASIALSLWAFSWLARWAVAVLEPILNVKV